MSVLKLQINFLQYSNIIVLASYFDKFNKSVLLFKSFHPSPGRKYSGVTHTAYVPDTEKGRLVTRLLNVAFSRGLLFTVKSSSACKPCNGSIVWNGIIHKTSIKGGPDKSVSSFYRELSTMYN